MKVLLLTPKHPPSYTDDLYLALRAKVGTCDFYPLDERQSSNLEEFFARHIRLAHFDRILLMFDGKFIYEQSPFLRRLPTLGVLSLNYDGNDALINKRMISNFTTMPWLRWIGSNLELCHQYQDQGYDAYWIPSVFDNQKFVQRIRKRVTRYCYVYGNKAACDLVSESLSHAMSVMPLSKEEVLNDDSIHFASEDIFVFWPDTHDNDMSPMIKAMACGAAVVSRDVSMEKRVLYGWHEGRDMLYATDELHLIRLLRQLVLDETLIRTLSHHAVQKVKLFYPQTVGKRIGAHLEVPVRNPGDYRMKQRIFGFDI
ncbi:MAG: glycosyltransferase [Cardiobacteriaceae bacterium]|nr:glycosyltransferase [Cardiobacteriaceae bacterium]